MTPDRRSPRQRLFAALYPPLAWSRVALEACARALPNVALPDGAFAPTELDKLHATALFMGPVDRRDVQRLATSVRGAAAGTTPFTVRFDCWRVLPAGQPARTLAIAARATPAACADLHRRLVQRCTPGRKSERPFLLHATLARRRTVGGALPGPAELAALEDLPADFEPVTFESLWLVESRLEATGARHLRLAEFPLGGR